MPSQIKIHIFGAISTLGKSLALHLNIPFFDADEFYWKKTEPPFIEAYPIEMRIQLLNEAILNQPSWVISGSMLNWSDQIKDHIFNLY